VFVTDSNSEYEKEYFETMPLQDDMWSRLFQKWNNQRTWQHLRGQIDAKARMLEVGPGNGSLLCFMRERGLNVEGCDLSQSISEGIRQRHGIVMHNCAIENISNPTPCDLIVMNHVVEHLNNPVAFLKDVRNRLSEGGRIHIAVPNIACWEALLPGWNSYEPYHLIYFTPATLLQTVEKAGFSIIMITTHDSFSGWFLATLRTLLKTRQKSSQKRVSRREERELSWIGHAYRLMMLLSGIATYPLRLIQMAIDRGDEIVLVAKNNAEKTEC
jgi:2-polyprenyl-3-methyl-5-hydroxy-6-metoxy-1,4-benzoquinol methylase